MHIKSYSQHTSKNIDCIEDETATMVKYTVLPYVQSFRNYSLKIYTLSRAVHKYKFHSKNFLFGKPSTHYI